MIQVPLVAMKKKALDARLTRGLNSRNLNRQLMHLCIQQGVNCLLMDIEM